MSAIVPTHVGVNRTGIGRTIGPHGLSARTWG